MSSGNGIESAGFFGSRLSSYMSERRMTAVELALRTGVTYEHIRKMLRGIAFPSPTLLNTIRLVLKVDREELERLVSNDKMMRKFRQNFWILAGRNPELAPIYCKWDCLTSEQKQGLIDFVLFCARRNSKSRRTGLRGHRNQFE